MPEKDFILRENIRLNLVRLRLEHGLSQSDVAKITKRTRTAVASWEQGLSLPDLSTLYKLHLFYNKPMEYFFDNNEPQRMEA